MKKYIKADSSYYPKSSDYGFPERIKLIKNGRTEARVYKFWYKFDGGAYYNPDASYDELTPAEMLIGIALMDDGTIQTLYNGQHRKSNYEWIEV